MHSEACVRDLARPRRRQCGRSHDCEVTEGEEERGNVSEYGCSPWDTCWCSPEAEEVGGGVNLARHTAAGVGEDADVGVDAVDPAAIPCPRTVRTTRRSGGVLSGSGEAPVGGDATARRWRARGVFVGSRVRVSRGERARGEARVREQVEGVVEGHLTTREQVVRRHGSGRHGASALGRHCEEKGKRRDRQDGPTCRF